MRRAYERGSIRDKRGGRARAAPRPLEMRATDGVRVTGTQAGATRALGARNSPSNPFHFPRV